jgi:tetratricopeptide (TPR) repeat protein
MSSAVSIKPDDGKKGWFNLQPSGSASIPGFVVILGFALLYPLQSWIDATIKHPTASDDTLYLESGETIKKMSLGLYGLAADVYWIRTVQYFGRKIVDSGRPISADTKDIEMPLLAPLLNIVTTLDPHHQPAYRFGAIFLPERDMPAAISLLEKGIRENPDDWRLYQDLGYIYWQAGNAASGEERIRNYEKAADWYSKGGRIPGSMWWMRDLAGLMRIKGGSREAALVIYTGYLNSDDEMIRSQAEGRIKQLRSLDDLDKINAVLARYRTIRGVCPDNLRVIGEVLRSLGLTLNDQLEPVDPDGFPYEYDRNKCTARLVFKSSVMR